MSDLICRKEVFDWLQEQKQDVIQHSNSAIFANGIAGAMLLCIDIFESFIINQPTAYDVDKVIEQLERETICLENNYGDEVLCIPENIAIDIVKRGGVHDKR